MRIRYNKNWIRKAIHFLTLSFFLWLSGFGLFIYQIPHQVNDRETLTDGIIVLTGRKGRVQLGFDLVQKGLGKKLLITGVHPTVKMSTLLSGQKVERDPLKFSILPYLGYKAQNTRGNAQEAAEWVKEHNIQSIRLVTTNYHMKRSLLHFRQYLPSTTLIIPHPIEESLKKDMKTFRLLWTEYHKFLRDYIKSIFNS